MEDRKTDRAPEADALEYDVEEILREYGGGKERAPEPPEGTVRLTDTPADPMAPEATVRFTDSPVNPMVPEGTVRFTDAQVSPETPEATVRFTDGPQAAPQGEAHPEPEGPRLVEYDMEANAVPRPVEEPEKPQTAPVQAPRRSSEEEAGEEPGEEDRPRRMSGGRPVIYGATLGVLAAAVLAVVLECVAVFPDLPDPAWSILVIAGLTAAGAPIALRGGTELRERGRLPGSFVMLAAIVVYGCCGNLVEAAFAAALFDLLALVTDGAKNRELRFLTNRVAALHTGDRALDTRLEASLREAENGRIKPVVDLRRLSWLVALVFLALGAIFSVIPPLFDDLQFLKWLARAAVLLSLAVLGGDTGAALTYLGGIEASVHQGIYFSGTGAMTAAAEVTSVLFNKTGTLTDGAFRVINVEPVRLSEEQLIYLAVHADAYSDHALARALRAYAGYQPDTSIIGRHRTQEGYGSVAEIDGLVVAVGNIDFMEGLKVRGNLYVPGDTCVFVAVGRTCVGRIDFADTLRPAASVVVRELKREGVANVALITGDNALGATNTAREVGITEVYSDCRPRDKAERLRYIQDTQDPRDRTAFVSAAGSNREILELANFSVTLGQEADMTSAFPDALIPTGDLARLPKVFQIPRRIRRRMTAMFLVSALIRVLCAVLAVIGVLPMWAAVLAVSVLELASVAGSQVASD